MTKRAGEEDGSRSSPNWSSSSPKISSAAATPEYFLPALALCFRVASPLSGSLDRRDFFLDESRTASRSQSSSSSSLAARIETGQIRLAGSPPTPVPLVALCLSAASQRALLVRPSCDICRHGWSPFRNTRITLWFVGWAWCLKCLKCLGGTKFFSTSSASKKDGTPSTVLLDARAETRYGPAARSLSSSSTRSWCPSSSRSPVPPNCGQTQARSQSLRDDPREGSQSQSRL